MSKVDFSKIAAKYEAHSSIQKSAGDILLGLLEIGRSDDVLDLGCGVGSFTLKLRELTDGKIAGVDPSEGMIKVAMEKSRDLDIIFRVQDAEEMDYEDSFDVIFCNSVLQWFKDPQKAVKNCRTALRRGGRMGVQAPAKKAYSPNFIEAIKKVKEDPKTRDIFAHFKEPWFFLEASEEYRNLFEKTGFKVIFSKMESIKSKHTPEEIFNIFSSGAIAGYLSQDYYDVKIDEDYIETFKKIIRRAFAQQASYHGKVELIFNRIFLVAIKD